MTLINLLEIHRTLAVCEAASAAVRQHSRSKCGELLSEIALTAQKVVVIDGKYLSNFIVYDTTEDTNAPDITDIISPLTVTSLLSIGGFAGTFMPLPSRTTYKDYSNPSDELIDRLINCPSEKTVEINFNLASRTLWSSFVTTTLKTTNNQSRIYIVPSEDRPVASPNASTSSSDTPAP
ncbi:hypothetical protein BDM02DRAFT_3117823 [Thelephora ganbajun]|uniref:Uncharacterized protein n=1 Tax=Thelephora ganbajun TaxID=370292 RepID=A0ACB6ZBI8_THEGA|nr:hypothetical protein BDM02DRAFT_3117823 [Thelephora ganbajun]